MMDYWRHPPLIERFNIRNYENIWSDYSHSTVSAELLYVLEGKLTLTLENGLAFPACAGDFLLLPAHAQHRDIFETDKGLLMLFMQFRWDGAEEFFSVVDNRTLSRLDFAIRSEAMRRIDLMHEQWDVDDEWSIQNVSIQLHALLALFYDSALRDSGDGNSSVHRRVRSDVMHQIKFFMIQNYASEVTLEKMARRFGISTAYLSRLFRRELGVSFNRYLTTLRLEAAVALLHNTSLQIAEVAQRSGFSDSSYFIKVFHRYYGTTPRDYRLGGNITAPRRRRRRVKSV